MGYNTNRPHSVFKHIGVNIYKYDNDNVSVRHQTLAPINDHDDGGGWLLVASYGVRCDTDGVATVPRNCLIDLRHKLARKAEAGAFTTAKDTGPDVVIGQARVRRGTRGHIYDPSATTAQSVRGQHERTPTVWPLLRLKAHTVYTNPRTYEHQRTFTARPLLDVYAHPAIPPQLDDDRETRARR